MNEQLLKTSGADVLYSRKKLRQTSWCGGLASTPSPPVRPRVNIKLCLHYTGQFFVSTRKAFRYSMTSNGPGLQQVLHTSRICTGEVGREDLEFQIPILTFRVQYLCAERYPICDSPLSSSAALLPSDKEIAAKSLFS